MLKSSHDQFRMITNHLKNAFSPWLLPLSLQVFKCHPLGEAFPNQVDVHPFILCHSLSSTALISIDKAITYLSAVLLSVTSHWVVNSKRK